MQASAVQAVEDAKQAAIQSVDDAKQAAVQSVEDAKQAALNKMNAFIEDVKAIPSRTAAAINKKLNELGEEIQLLPGRIALSVQTYAANKKAQAQQAFELRLSQLKSSFPLRLLFPTSEVVNAEAPKAKAEAPKVEAPKPKVEAKVEAPKAKAEAPKVEAPKPKVEASPFIAGFSDLFGKQHTESSSKSSSAEPVKTSSAAADKDIKVADASVASSRSSGFSFPSIALNIGAKSSTPVPAAASANNVAVKADTKQAVASKPSATSTPSSEGQSKSSLKLEIPKLTIAGNTAKEEVITTSDIAAVVRGVSETAAAKTNPSPAVAQKSSPSAGRMGFPTTFAKPPAKISTKTSSPPDPDFKPMTTSSVLSSVAVKALSMYPESTSLKVEAAVKAFLNSEIPTEILYKDIASALGSKDKAFLVLPDIIGSLPRGDKKTALNSFYQNQA